MTRQMIKLITATFAVVMALSLASITWAEKGSGWRSPFEQPKGGGGKQPAECINATAALNKYIASPGEEISSTVTVNNCSKDDATVTVEQVLTDSCGDSWTMSVTTLNRLRKGETRQAMVSFLAPGCNGATITAMVTTQKGTAVPSPLASLTITNPAP